MNKLEVQSGANSSAYKSYKHLVSTNLFGVRDRIKEMKKNPNKRKRYGRK